MQNVLLPAPDVVAFRTAPQSETDKDQKPTNRHCPLSEPQKWLPGTTYLFRIPCSTAATAGARASEHNRLRLVAGVVMPSRGPMEAKGLAEDVTDVNETLMLQRQG